MCAERYNALACPNTLKYVRGCAFVLERPVAFQQIHCDATHRSAQAGVRSLIFLGRSGGSAGHVCSTASGWNVHRMCAPNPVATYSYNTVSGHARLSPRLGYGLGGARYCASVLASSDCMSRTAFKSKPTLLPSMTVLDAASTIFLTFL